MTSHSSKYQGTKFVTIKVCVEPERGEPRKHFSHKQKGAASYYLNPSV